MHKTISECVCCDVCHHCGRNKTIVNICDNCGCEISRKSYEYEGDELCRECCEELVEKLITENMKTFVSDAFDNLLDYFCIEEEKE